MWGVLAAAGSLPAMNTVKAVAVAPIRRPPSAIAIVKRSPSTRSGRSRFAVTAPLILMTSCAGVIPYSSVEVDVLVKSTRESTAAVGGSSVHNSNVCVAAAGAIEAESKICPGSVTRTAAVNGVALGLLRHVTWFPAANENQKFPALLAVVRCAKSVVSTGSDQPVATTGEACAKLHSVDRT